MTYDILSEITSFENGKREVVDFDKLELLNYGINLIISERGIKGKTFSAKSHLIKKWKDYHEKSIWLWNTETQMSLDIIKFFSKHKKEQKFKLLENIELRKTGIYDKLTNEIFCYFVALSTSEKLKGSRPSVDRVFYDEFNIGLTQIGEKQTPLLYDLISTVSDPGPKCKLKVFIFGNNKTMNVPFLIDNEITSIEDEFSTFEINKTKCLFIYAPKPDAKKVDEIYKNNWSYQMAKKSGIHKFSYLNQNIWDDDENIIPKKNIIFNDWTKKSDVLKIKNNYFSHYVNKLNRLVYFLKLKDKPKNQSIVCARPVDMEADIFFNKNLRKLLLHHIQKKDKVFFDSYSTKLNILNII